MFSCRIFTKIFIQSEKVVELALLDTVVQGHTNTHTHTHTHRKRLQWCISEICKYAEKRKSANTERGSERGKQSFNVGEKQQRMSQRCKIIPSKHICMCFHYMAGYIYLFWLIYEDARAQPVRRYYTGGLLSGSEWDGKTMDHMNANERVEKCSGQRAATRD